MARAVGSKFSFQKKLTNEWYQNVVQHGSPKQVLQAEVLNIFSVCVKTGA